jgi:hypothetical protein
VGAMMRKRGTDDAQAASDDQEDRGPVDRPQGSAVREEERTPWRPWTHFLEVADQGCGNGGRQGEGLGSQRLGACPRGSPVGSHALPPRGASRVAWNLLVQACRRQYPGGTADGIEFAPLKSATAAFPVARPVERPLAGWELHPLKVHAFSRRTRKIG